MSFGKHSSKKDETDYKEYAKAADADTTETATATTTVKEVDAKGLQEALEGKENSKGVKEGGKGISFTVFANADEHYRKRVLKGDYEALKLKHGWLYDQPIEG